MAGRKPKGYWNSIENVVREFWQFVEEHGADKVNAGYVGKQYQTLYLAIKKNFSGFPLFAEEVGFNYRTIKPKGYWDDMENLIKEFYQFVEEHGADNINNAYLQKNHSTLIWSIVNHYKGLQAFVEDIGYTGYTYTPSRTDESIIEEFLQLYNAGEDVSYTGLRKNHDKLRGVIDSHFGSLKALCEYVGLDYYQDVSKTDKPFKAWTPDIVKQELLNLYHAGEDINSVALQTYNSALYQAIKRHFGTFENIFNEIDIDYQEIKKLTTWDCGMVQEEFTRLYNNGENVSPSALGKYHPALSGAIISHFGSYKAFCGECNIPYSEVTIELHNVAYIKLGYQFESLLDELFTELGVQYKKYGSGYTGCRPDYIFSPDVWADAKLSASLTTNKMRKKYLQHCKELTVYYLVKDRLRVPAQYADGTKRVHVYKLLEDAPEDIRAKYNRIFKDIEAEYHELMSQREAV